MTIVEGQNHHGYRGPPIHQILRSSSILCTVVPRYLQNFGLAVPKLCVQNSADISLGDPQILPFLT